MRRLPPLSILVPCAAALLMAAGPLRAENRALLVGVEEYDRSDIIRPFAAASADAQELATALTAGGQFSEANVHVLTSHRPTKPTRRAILDALDGLAHESTPQDIVFIFFEGHGTMRHGVSALWPSDVDPTSDDTSAASSIPASAFRDLIQKIPCKVLVMAFDISRETPMKRGVDSRRYNLLSGLQAHAFLSDSARTTGTEPPKTPTVVIYSCSPHRIGSEWKGIGRGYFGYFLDQGIRSTVAGGAADEQGVVTLQHLLAYVPKAVQGATERSDYDWEQIPYILTSGTVDTSMMLATGRTPQSGGRTAVPLEVGASPKQRFDAYFQTGAEMSAAGRDRDAEMAFKKALAINPRSTPTLSSLGFLAEIRGDARAAEAFHRRSLAIQPRSVALLRILANFRAAHAELIEAEPLYKRAMALDPADPMAPNEYGAMCAAASRIKDAERLFRVAAELDPAWSDPLISLANGCLNRKEFADAEKLYRQAVAVEPDSVDAVEGLGSFYGNVKKNYARAETIYRSAIQTCPWISRYRSDLGDTIVANKGDVAEAEQLFRKAIDLDPRDADPVYSLADLYRDRKGGEGEAERLYRRVIALAPDHARALTDLGVILDNRGDYLDAERLYRRAMAADSKSSEAIAYLAGIYLYRRKDSAAAERLFSRALKIDPNDSYTLNGLGAVAIDKGQKDAAKRLFRKAMASDPQNVDPVNGLASVLYDDGEVSAAEKLYRKALALNADSSEAMIGLACILWNRNEVKAAESLYRRGLKIDPKNVDGLVGLGQIYTDRRDYVEAGKLFDAALQIEPQNADALGGRAEVYASNDLSTEDQQKAVGLYRRAIALDPTYAWYHVGLADCLFYLGRKQEARVEAKLGLRLGYKEPNYVFNSLKLKK